MMVPRRRSSLNHRLSPSGNFPIAPGTFASTKFGGTLTMSAANTYSGTTNVLGGVFTLNGPAGALQSTAAVNVSGNATSNLGDSTAGNGLANRINTAANLTLGGTVGAGSLAVVRGSTVANSQTLAFLSDPKARRRPSGSMKRATCWRSV